MELDDGSLRKSYRTRQGQMFSWFTPLVTQMCSAPAYFRTNGLPGEARPRQQVTGQGHLLVPIKDTSVDTQLK